MSFAQLKKDLLFYTLLIIIAALAIFFRTYNYQNRIFVQADNSRDVQIARYAADNFKLPAIGQFSSAGPFFYGPWYYWFLEIISFLPLGPLTHWYATTTIYLLFIVLIFYLGKLVGGKWLGLTASLYAAISPAQITYSFSTWNPAIVPTLTLLILIFLVRFAKYQKPRDLFFLGFTTSLAITIHFQSILASVTLIVALALIFLTKDLKKQKIKLSFLLFFGAFIPFLPLIYFDARHNWYNFVSLFIFLTIDQYKIWIPNRWLTYLGTYWPNTWSYILGGTKFVATLIIILLSLFSASKLKNITKNKLFFIIAVTFLLEITLYRFYRGERYQYYSLFAHPFIFLLTAWLTVQIYNFKRLLGIAFATIVLFLAISVAKVDLKPRGVTFGQINNLKNEIYAQYPTEKFDIYGCKYNIDSISHPIALFTYIDNRNSLSGIKIGVCEAEKTLVWHELSAEETVTDNGSWFNKSTPEVYRHTVEWWIEKPPGGGNFWQFLKKNYNPACYPHC